MVDFYSIPSDELPMTMKALQRRAKERGWPKISKLYHPGPSILFATRPDGQEVRIFAAVPPTSTDFACNIARDKLATYNLLKTINAPQPETIDAVHGDITNFIKEQGKIVIKPTFGAHGRDIFTNITDPEEVAKIITELAPRCEQNSVIAQKQVAYDGNEVRAIYINGEYVVAFERIPAAITGDGEHSVAELIDIENQTIRTEAYKSNLAFINKEEALKYLGDTANNIPEQGVKVRVSSTCNIGMGGTVKTVQLSATQRAVSTRVAKVTGLKVVGIDFFGENILEINSSPSLYMPSGDEFADLAVRKYLEYLESI